MSEELKDILSNLQPGIDQETLLRYLQGHMSSEEQHEVEKQMQADDFDADAFEGLQNFRDKEKLQLVVAQLQKDLRKKTEQKKARRRRREISIDPWVVLAIVLILALVVISYFLIHQHLHHR